MKPLTVLLVLAFLQSIYAASLYAVAEHKDVVHLYSLDTNTKEAKLINTTTGKIDTGAPFVAREADVFAVGMAEDSQSAFMLHRDSADGQLFGLSMLDQQGYIQKVADNGQITSTLFKFPTGWYAYEPIASLCFACRKFFNVMWTKDAQTQNLYVVDLDSGALAANHTINFALRSLIMDPVHRELFGLAFNSQNHSKIDVVNVKSMDGKIGEVIMTLDRNDIQYGGSIDAENQILYVATTKSTEVLVIDVKAKKVETVKFALESIESFSNVAFWK